MSRTAIGTLAIADDLTLRARGCAGGAVRRARQPLRPAGTRLRLARRRWRGATPAVNRQRRPRPPHLVPRQHRALRRRDRAPPDLIIVDVQNTGSRRSPSSEPSTVSWAVADSLVLAG